MIDHIVHEFASGQWSEWITPLGKPFEFECLACDQVHQFEFRLGDGGEIQLRLRDVDA